MENLIARLDTFLRYARPEFYQLMQSGLTEKEMADFEEELGLELPSELKAFYYWRNGLKKIQFFIDGWELMSSKQILEDCRMQSSFLDNGTLAPDWWDKQWIPFLSNNGDLLCIDLAGSFGGVKGQILEFLHDDFPINVHYESFQKWVETLVETLEHNLVSYDKYGLNTIVNEEYAKLFNKINPGYPKFFTTWKD
jgi:cell wall assembly regulator SMI1